MVEIKPKNICPLYREPCKELECSWFTQLRGLHPQTGKEIDEWGCAIAWLPVLLIENAKEARQGAAAVESFRNEMVRLNEVSLALTAERQKTGRLVNGKNHDHSSR
jgi:hypothetical protein